MGKLTLTEGFSHHTTIKIHLRDETPVLLDGLAVEMPEDLKEFELVLHRPHVQIKGDKVRFKISERKTGHVVGRGYTKKEALEDALRRMRSFSVDDIKQMIDMKLLARREGNDKKEEKEIQEVEAEKLGRPTYESDSKVRPFSRSKKATK